MKFSQLFSFFKNRMGANSSSFSELGTNDYLRRFSSTEAISPQDPFWNQLLSYTFLIPINRYHLLIYLQKRQFYLSKRIDICLISAWQYICCGYSLEAHCQVVSDLYPQHVFKYPQHMVPRGATSNEYLKDKFSWRNKKNVYLIRKMFIWILLL